MRILLDECLPRKLKNHLAEHECRTVQEMGWAGKSNGDLLDLAESQFEVFVTIDANLRYQQSLRGRRIAILVLRCRSNRYADLEPLAQTLHNAVRAIQPGTVAYVG
jgi:predicted nuclease of predicted toxin-antitoxin system